MASVPSAPFGAFTHDSLRDEAPERYAALFDPVKIGPVTAPNRFYATPYATAFSMHEIAQEAGHRAMRAEGGWGVVNLGETPISPEATLGTFQTTELFTDDDARELAKVTEAIHEYGALAGIELAHNGGLSSASIYRYPAMGATQMQSDAVFFSNEIGSTMTAGEVAGLQDKWVAAARRARDAGFDIIYVHCAHSGGPMQFLAPYYNQRTDQYGGSLENRARFMLEILERIREEVGDDTAIAVRYGIEALGVGGLGIDEALAVMRMSDHLVDLWDIAIGGLSNAERDLTPSRLYPEGASLEWSKRAKEGTDKLVVGSSRFTDVDLMLSVIKSGTLDFVGAARPGISDPFLPRKVAAGEFAQLRECIGCNRCAFSQFAGNMSCVQNATTGEEYRRGWHPENFTVAKNADQPALIVGAGPAGAECATVLGRRGFETVHLVDEGPKLGGHLHWFIELPGFNPWGHVIEHREVLVDSLSRVEFIPNTRLDAQGVLDYGAEIVIVATGAPWQTEGINFFDNSPIPGADASLPNVLTPEQLILGEKPVPGSKVVVYDVQADLNGVGVATYLQGKGFDVELVSPFADIANHAHQDGVSFALRAEILEAGGKLRPGLVMAAAGKSGATFLDETMSPVEIECDALVMLTRRASDDGLYHELIGMPDRLGEAGIEAVYRIGDCVAPQHLSEAIFSGHRLAREIDSQDPAVPLFVPRS